MIGYENRVTSDESFTEARKEFAEIPMGASTTVFYELELVDDSRGLGSGAVKLGEVELRWVTPETGDSNRQHAAIMDSDTHDSMDSALLQFRCDSCAVVRPVQQPAPPGRLRIRLRAR